MSNSREITTRARATRAERTQQESEVSPSPSSFEEEQGGTGDQAAAPSNGDVDSRTADHSLDDEQARLAQQIAEAQEVLARLQATQEQKEELQRINAEIEQLARGAGVAQAGSRPPAPSVDTRSLLGGVRVEEDEDEMSVDGTRSRRTGASQLSTRAPLYQNPTPFKGKDLKEATMFLNAWRTIHTLDPRRYAGERQKVLSASTFLAGEPLERWSNDEIKKFAQDDEYDFDDFEEFINACVSDPHNRSFTLGLEYENAAQKKDQTVSSFAAYLATLEDQLGAGYTDAQSARHLLNKLRPNIREDIMIRGQAYATRTDLIALATRFEQVSKDRSTRSHEQRSEGQQKHPAKKARYGSAPSANRDGRAEGSTQKPSFPTSGDKRNDTCNNCGLKGHWAKECRKPARAAVRAVNASEASAGQNHKAAQGKGIRRKKTRNPA
jgi:hypothetical protein